MKAEEFLREFKKRCREDVDNITSVYYPDAALYRILDHDIDAWFELFETLSPSAFHAVLRQNELFDHPDIDMAVWHLIGCSKYFWQIVKEFEHNIEDDSDYEADMSVASIIGYGRITSGGTIHALKDNGKTFCDTNATSNYELIDDVYTPIYNTDIISCKRCIKLLNDKGVGQ